MANIYKDKYPRKVHRYVCLHRDGTYLRIEKRCNNVFADSEIVIDMIEGKVIKNRYGNISKEFPILEDSFPNFRID